FTRILFYRLFPNKEYPQALPHYKHRLSILGLKTLYHRRILADILLAHKIIRQEVQGMA
ncbi:unnamed protein product, partial [Cylicocyclus nassatus]